MNVTFEVSETAPPVRLIRLPEVLALTGLSRSAIYQRMSDGIFPKQVSLGGQGQGAAVAWIEAEIRDWVAQRIAASRPDTARPTDDLRPAA